MPNNLVFNNNSAAPLYVAMTNSNTNPSVVIDPAGSSATKGQFFSMSTSAQSVAANGFLVFQATNPSGSGKTMYIARLSGGATTNTIIDIIRNGTFTATGTAVTPRNTNTAFSDNSVMTGKFISQTTDPTQGTVIMNSIIQVGGPVVVDYDGRIIITPNNTLAVRLSNTTNQVNILATNLSWWEY